MNEKLKEEIMKMWLFQDYFPFKTREEAEEFIKDPREYYRKRGWRKDNE